MNNTQNNTKGIDHKVLYIFQPFTSAFGKFCTFTRFNFNCITVGIIKAKNTK